MRCTFTTEYTLFQVNFCCVQRKVNAAKTSVQTERAISILLLCIEASQHRTNARSEVAIEANENAEALLCERNTRAVRYGNGQSCGFRSCQ